MDDSLKAGLKTSEGITTVITVLASAVVNILVALNVINAADSQPLLEVVVKGASGVVIAVVSGIVLVNYIKQRTWIKYQAMKRGVTNG